MRAVLTDIEGTTTPLSFVHEVLFPYARRRLDAAFASGDPRFAAPLRTLREEHGEETRIGFDLPAFGNGAPYAHWLMDRLPGADLAVVPGGHGEVSFGRARETFAAVAAAYAV